MIEKGNVLVIFAWRIVNAEGCRDVPGLVEEKELALVALQRRRQLGGFFQQMSAYLFKKTFALAQLLVREVRNRMEALRLDAQTFHPLLTVELDQTWFGSVHEVLLVCLSCQ